MQRSVIYNICIVILLILLVASIFAIWFCPATKTKTIDTMEMTIEMKDKDNIAKDDTNLALRKSIWLIFLNTIGDNIAKFNGTLDEFNTFKIVITGPKGWNVPKENEVNNKN